MYETHMLHTIKPETSNAVNRTDSLSLGTEPNLSLPNTKP